MSVDRQGTALIQGWGFGPPLHWYLKGVSTVDAGGMTFVADSPTTTTDSLYSAVLSGSWGGDFWFFLRPTGSAPAWMVGRYRTSDQSFRIIVSDIAAATKETGLGITAVAISSCAPPTPPN